MAEAALLKPWAPPSVHSLPRCRHPPALDAAEAADSTTVARTKSEPSRRLRTPCGKSFMQIPERTIAPPSHRCPGGSPPRKAEPRPYPPPAMLLYCAAVGARAGAELPGRSAYLHLGLDPRRSNGWAGLSADAQLICVQEWGVAMVVGRVYGFLQCFLNRKRGAGDDGVWRLCRRKTLILHSTKAPALRLLYI